MNHKRVYRLRRDDGLSLWLKRPRRNVIRFRASPLRAGCSPFQLLLWVS